MSKLSMVKKLDFWKRSWKVTKAVFEFITIYIFTILIIFLSGYIFLGFFGLIGNELSSNSIEFAKYLTGLAFSLAGFTFLASTLIKRKEDKITQTEIDILNVSYLFIVAGFFGLLFLALNYLPSTTIVGKPVEYYDFFKKYIFPASILTSMAFFLGALNFLLILLRIKIPNMYKKYKEQNKKKKSWKHIIREVVGFD